MAGKAELAASVAVALNVPKAAATALIESVISGVSELTETGDKLILRGFGTFVNKTSKARTGRNPQTGAPLQIEAKTKLTFKAAK